MTESVLAFSVYYTKGPCDNFAIYQPDLQIILTQNPIKPKLTPKPTPHFTQHLPGPINPIPTTRSTGQTQNK
jgi:hypothetical protein